MELEPEVSRRILRRVVGAVDRDVVEGELGEGFRTRAAREGGRSARAWYRRQVIGFVLRAASAPIARREEARMRWRTEVGADVRWALRSMLGRPTFTLVAIATLALGIGSNSAIFTLAGAHFLAPLPYERSRELVLLWEADRTSGETMTVSPGNYFAWKEAARSFSGLAAFNVDRVTLSGEDVSERVPASVVTPDFFSVLGVRAALGTTFTPEAVRAAAGEVVVLGHGLWKDRYGADPGVIGRDIRIDGRPHRVLGVMPEGFRQPERELTWQGARLWRPLVLDGEHDDFRSRYLRTIARLAPGVPLERARSEMAALADRLARAHPVENGAWTVGVYTVDDYLLGDARPVLLLLLGAGAAVLLIVCANVANLTLARGQERRREFAVRAALGSGGARLLRLVFVEGVLLATLGGALGIAGVHAAGGALQALQERYFSGLVDVSVDGRVVASTMLIALVAGVLFSLPVARTASRPVSGALGEGDARSGAGRSVTGLRSALIVGQVALATMLLVTAALLVRSFDALVGVPPGFDPSDRITFSLSTPAAKYADAPARERYFREVWREVEGVPGVSGVAMASDLPFTDENRWTELRLEGMPLDDADTRRVDFHTVLPEYFEVMGIPLVAGRLFSSRWETVPPERIEIVVNERMAAMTAPGGDVLGKGVVLERNGTRITLRVVGVVGDVLDDGYAGRPEPIFYWPWGASPQRSMSVVVRAEGEAAAVMEGVRRAVARVDPDVPATNLRTMEAMLAETAARPRAASRVGMTFAMLALLLAAAGIYGVLSYAVQSRTREIGVRAALGADGPRLLSMVLGHSTRLLALGLVLGLLAALVAGRALSGVLFGVRSWDPPSFVLAAVLLGGVGTLAAWVPARRAVRIDPNEALRSG